METKDNYYRILKMIDKKVKEQTEECLGDLA